MSSDESVRQERGDDAALIERARAIHGKILSIDSHIDFAPGDLTDARNYTERLETQFDLPKMIEGDLKALFFSIYVGQTRETQNPEAFKASGYERAHKLAVEKFEAVRHFTTDIAGAQIELARSADDVRRIAAGGKRAALMGVENGYPL